MSQADGRVARLGKTVLMLAVVIAAVVGVPRRAEAEYSCTTTHFSDGTCRTTCVYTTPDGRPAGFMNCTCCS
jgi:hypothetical protein